MNKRKVVIIGAGHVGSHCAMALAFGGVCEEIVLLDTDLEKARANAMDVADACLFTPGSCTVHVGNYCYFRGSAPQARPNAAGHAG